MRRSARLRTPRHRDGFTLIELLVVMAIIAMLLTLSVPRYFRGLDASRETILRENLRAVRQTLDQFKSDTGRYPESLDELVQRQYLKALPVDPVTDSNSTWQLMAPANDGVKGNVADVRSGANGHARDGTRYADW